MHQQVHGWSPAGHTLAKENELAKEDQGLRGGEVADDELFKKGDSMMKQAANQGLYCRTTLQHFSRLRSK